MSGFGTAQLPKAGDIVAGKYSLERIIGQGGMGAVFAARHVKLGHAVAIKVMLADRQNEEAARRFMNEGRASAHIQNDHVVRIFDIDEEHGYAYMVLELLQGEDLGQVLEQQGRLAPHVAVGYVLQALEGVRQAHALGIVHRDLKPSNLFLARLQNGSVIVKVLDFGISKAGGSALDLAPHQQTSTAAMLGSPLYMSPEQLRSSKNVDARADIWAIGVILHELLTGSVPFEGDTLGALFAAILESDAPRVSAKVREVPPGLDAIVSRCLQRRPEDRFASAADLERELGPFATAQASAAYPLMMTAAMPPQAVAAAPPGARASVGSSAYGVPQSLASPVAHTAYAASAQSSAHLSQHAVVAPGVAPLGAMTPQPYQQTGNTWQSTGSQSAKSSSLGLVLGIVIGVVAIAAVVIGVSVYKHRGGATGLEASASASASGLTSAASAPSAHVAAGAEPPSTPVRAIAIASASASAAPGIAPATASPSATSAPSSAPSTVTTAAAHATTPSTKHGAATPVAKVDPKPPEPVKVNPPPAPPPPRPAPVAAPTGGTLQSGR